MQSRGVSSLSTLLSRLHLLLTVLAGHLLSVKVLKFYLFNTDYQTFSVIRRYRSEGSFEEFTDATLMSDDPFNDVTLAKDDTDHHDDPMKKS